MRKFSLLIALLISILFSTTHVCAIDNADNQIIINQIIVELRKANVPEDQIIGLVDKYLKGETWDVFKQEYANLKPQIIKPNYEKTIYPDDSYMINQIEDLSVVEHGNGHWTSYSY